MIVVDQAEKHHLDLILAVAYDLRLYKTDVTLGLTQAQKDALTEASFTEATFTGYAAKALSGGSWTTATGNPATGSYATQTFTSSADQSPQLVYGYYVTRHSDNKLQWFEPFPGPVVFEFNGEFYQVTPRLTFADTAD
ncbi:hypothetical protein J5X84_36100 [Streptosporangiaceae bacterium NEAU-GS5]|nr:hypothetical protein [Streptosporangiaceae bacterium NEAU-GS5]